MEHGSSEILKMYKETGDLTEGARLSYIRTLGEYIIFLYGPKPSQEQFKLVATAAVELVPKLKSVDDKCGIVSRVILLLYIQVNAYQYFF